MTTTNFDRQSTGGHIRAGDVELWFDQRGNGPDVLLIAGLSDPAEAWEPQLTGLAATVKPSGIMGERASGVCGWGKASASSMIWATVPSSWDRSV